MSYNKTVRNVIGAVVTTTPFAYTFMTSNADTISWFPKMVIIRKELIKSCFSSKIKILEIGKNRKYVEHPVLEQDIRNCINDESGGVKILWAPPGTGKSTSVYHVINAELETGNISGVLMLTPPRMSVEPDEWFRYQFRYLGIETLTQNEHLSTLIEVPSNKPFVIVIDQCDNLDFNDKLRKFIKVLAEDSHGSKKYVVLAICTNAAKAATMKEWNGGIKIKLLNHKYNAYKWSVSQIEKWIEQNLKDHKTINPINNIAHYNKFKKAAIVAGTGDFLITNTCPTENQSLSEIENSWNAKSNYVGQIWGSGQLLYPQSFWWWR